MKNRYLWVAAILFVGMIVLLARSETLGAVALFVMGSIVLNKALRGNWLVSKRE